VLDADEVEAIFARAVKHEPNEFTMSIEARTVTDTKGLAASFEIDDFRYMCLMEGLDRIGLTLRHEDDISTYERDR